MTPSHKVFSSVDLDPYLSSFILSSGLVQIARALARRLQIGRKHPNCTLVILGPPTDLRRHPLEADGRMLNAPAPVFGAVRPPFEIRTEV